MDIRPADFGKLGVGRNPFGDHGACGGCWCMYWRLPAREFKMARGEQNHQKFKRLAQIGEPQGILAISEGKAIGWCAFSPRSEYRRLENSRILKPIDDTKVWSIVCFFIHPKFRRKGVQKFLIKESIVQAKNCGASILEAYPHELTNKSAPDLFIYTGVVSAFLANGFQEVARRSSSRPILRKYL